MERRLTLLVEHFITSCSSICPAETWRRYLASEPGQETMLPPGGLHRQAVVGVIGDGVLTALRLLATDFSAAFLIPIFTIALEIVCAGFLISHIRGVILRAAHAAAGLRT